MTKFKVNNFVFCEDARVEASGKHVLIGVSAPALNVAQIPGNILISLWLSGTTTQTGQLDIDFRVRDPAKESVVKGKLHALIAGIGSTALVLGPVPLALKRAGDYCFEWTFDKKKWEKIGILQIYHTPLAPEPGQTAPD